MTDDLDRQEWAMSLPISRTNPEPRYGYTVSYYEGDIEYEQKFDTWLEADNYMSQLITAPGISFIHLKETK